MKQRKRNKIIRSLIKAITPEDGYADEDTIVVLNEFIDLYGDLDREEFWHVKRVVMSCYLAGMKACMPEEVE